MATKPPKPPKGVSAALTQPRRRGEALTDDRFEGIPDAAIKRELRERRLTSRSRDVRANKGAAHGEYVNTAAMRRFAKRGILAYAKRAGEGDIELLGDVASLHDEVDAAVGVAARALNAQGFSWAEIGDRLGMDRRSAWDKYKDPDGNRRLRGTQLKNGRAAKAGQNGSSK